MLHVHSLLSKKQQSFVKKPATFNDNLGLEKNMQKAYIPYMPFDKNKGDT